MPNLLQRPFSVGVERFGPANHVVSVVTLTGHPLAGWRYFRVYSIAPNDVVVETGAVDTAGPGPLNKVLSEGEAVLIAEIDGIRLFVESMP